MSEPTKTAEGLFCTNEELARLGIICEDETREIYYFVHNGCKLNFCMDIAHVNHEPGKLPKFKIPEELSIVLPEFRSYFPAEGFDHEESWSLCDDGYARFRLHRRIASAVAAYNVNGVEFLCSQSGNDFESMSHYFEKKEVKTLQDIEALVEVTRWYVGVIQSKDLRGYVAELGQMLTIRIAGYDISKP